MRGADASSASSASRTGSAGRWGQGQPDRLGGARVPVLNADASRR